MLQYRIQPDQSQNFMCCLSCSCTVIRQKHPRAPIRLRYFGNCCSAVSAANGCYCADDNTTELNRTMAIDIDTTDINNEQLIELKAVYNCNISGSYDYN